MKELAVCAALCTTVLCGTSWARETALYQGRLTSDLNGGGFAITNLASPSAESDAATKGYVDSIGGMTPEAATNIADNAVDRGVATWARHDSPVPSSEPPDYASVSNAAMGALASSPDGINIIYWGNGGVLEIDGDQALLLNEPIIVRDWEFVKKNGTYQTLPDYLASLAWAPSAALVSDYGITNAYTKEEADGLFITNAYTKAEADGRYVRDDSTYSTASSILAAAEADAKTMVGTATNGLVRTITAGANITATKVGDTYTISASGGGSPSAPTTETSIVYNADGTAIIVSVPANGTLSADTTGWVVGQTQTAMITIASGASVSPSIVLVGYSGWVTDRQFIAECVLVGTNVYVNPVAAVR